MVTPRIDVQFRVDDSTEQLSVNHSVSGVLGITLTHGTYPSLALLCSEIQTRIQVLDAQLTCVESNGTVTIADSNGDDFAVTWTHPGLRNWRGFAAGLAGTDTYTAPLQSPGTWRGQIPIEVVGAGFEWTFRRFEGHHQTGAAVRIGRADLWDVVLQERLEQLAQLRLVLTSLLTGQRWRLWQSEAHPTRYVDVRLHPDSRDYADRWLGGGGVLTDVSIPLLLVEA